MRLTRMYIHSHPCSDVMIKPENKLQAILFVWDPAESTGMTHVTEAEGPAEEASVSTIVSNPHEYHPGASYLQRVERDAANHLCRNYLQIPFHRATNRDMHQFQKRLLATFKEALLPGPMDEADRMSLVREFDLHYDRERITTSH